METKELLPTSNIELKNPLQEEIDQLTEAVSAVTERLNDLYLLAAQNIKENPDAKMLKNSFTLPVSKKIKGKKGLEIRLNDDLKGRFRAFARVYHSISR